MRSLTSKTKTWVTILALLISGVFMLYTGKIFFPVANLLCAIGLAMKLELARKVTIVLVLLYSILMVFVFYPPMPGNDEMIFGTYTENSRLLILGFFELIILSLLLLLKNVISKNDNAVS